MKKLFEIVVVLQILGGAIFFAALFAAALPMPIKILAGIGLAFISSAVYLIMVSQLAVAESLRIMASFSIKDDEAQSTIQSVISNISGGWRVMQSTDKLGYSLLGMFVFWFVGGWVISGYVI